MTPEVERLRATLDGLRAAILKKLAGLSHDDARRSTVDSGTNLAGLVQHLTFVESRWFEEVVAGQKATRGNRSMRVDPSTRYEPSEPNTAAPAPPATRSSPRPATRTHQSPTTAPPPTFDRYYSPSSRRPPATPGTPTSSANKSTARPAAKPARAAICLSAAWACT
jgi:hypothetical protein